MRDPGGRFRTRYGWFFDASWELAEPVSATLSVNRSPLRVVRPLVDYEMHWPHEDIGRIIHERALTTYVQLYRGDEFSFVHGAAMVTPEGSGVLIGGHGGVGKTSLALEMGRRHGWGFLSDDLTVLDRAGNLYLNANRPKVYAYNVVGDPALERLLLEDRSTLNRIHWHVKKMWPDRVRRSISPGDLYPAVQQIAPMRHVIHVERSPRSDLQIGEGALDPVADSIIEILEHELRKTEQSLTGVLSDNDARLEHHTWDPRIWRETLLGPLSRAELILVQVPENMTAIEYRRRMASWLERHLGLR